MIYNVDFNQQAEDLSSPDKRDPSLIALVKSVLSAIQWCRDLILGSYKSGATAEPYAPGTYNIYNQVQFNNGVYESLIDNNTSSPGDLTKWKLIQDNFIGTDERILYNGNKLTLEYALNRWFKTTFRQPSTFNDGPDFYLPKSDIFISDLTVSANVVFVVGGNELNSSVIYNDKSSEVIIDDYSFVSEPNFTINVPAAFFISLGAGAEDKIRSFADKYVVSGIRYNVSMY